MTLDAGPLIGYERGDAVMMAEIDRMADSERPPTIPAAVIAEVWRGGRRSARLARLLRRCEVDPVDGRLARSAGELLARSGGEDAVDALVVASAASRGDAVLTSDPDDLIPLARASGRVFIVPV